MIESRDAGRSWSSVSPLGGADLHLLQARGTSIYGVDSATGMLFASSDNGRSWRQRTLPAATFSLVIDPRSERSMVVSTEKGLYASTDAARSWRPLASDRAGLLAWARPDALYLVDSDGAVQVSRDGGRRWTVTGDGRGTPAAFIADGTELYLALTDNLVERSEDGGRTWHVRARP